MALPERILHGQVELDLVLLFLNGWRVITDIVDFIINYLQ